MSTTRHGVGHKHFTRSPSSLVAVRRANLPYTLEHDAKLPRRSIMPILKRAFRHFKIRTLGDANASLNRSSFPHASVVLVATGISTSSKAEPPPVVVKNLVTFTYFPPSNCVSFARATNENNPHLIRPARTQLRHRTPGQETFFTPPIDRTIRPRAWKGRWSFVPFDRPDRQ